MPDKKYRVMIRRKLWAFTTVFVDAASEEEADEKALRMAVDIPHHEWDGTTEDIEKEDLDVLDTEED